MFDIKPYETKMEKAIAAYEEELSTVRAGRASAAVLNNINVDYYGSPTPIPQVADVKATDPRTVVVQPWDASLIKDIEKAILSSDLGINPQNDGKIIRLAFPQLTEEKRKELTKTISRYGEDAKIAIRNIRREANDIAKDMKKKSDLTEDDLKSAEKKVQDLTDKFTKIIDALTDKKSKEVMTV